MSVTLTKDATVLVLSKGQSFPFSPIGYTLQQPEAETDAGTRYIYDKGTVRTITIRAPRTPRTEYLALLSFLTNAVVWKAKSFTLTDERAQTFTVRLAQDDFGPVEQTFELYTIELVVRIE